MVLDPYLKKHLAHFGKGFQCVLFIAWWNSLLLIL